MVPPHIAVNKPKLFYFFTGYSQMDLPDTSSLPERLRARKESLAAGNESSSVRNGAASTHNKGLYAHN